MGDGAFNISKGVWRQYHDNVNGNTPAASRLTWMLLETGVTDATMRDYTTFAAILAGASIEAAFTSYVRIFETDATLGASTVDQGNDRAEADAPDPTWTPAGNGANETLARLILGYDALGTDADATTIPMFFYDFIVTTNGSNLIGAINALGYGRAS